MSKSDKICFVFLILVIILGVLYATRVRILVGDNWIIYAFGRGIDSYGFESYSELADYYESYTTYYPCFLWTLSKLTNLSLFNADLAMFLILFPLITIVSYFCVNKILKKSISSLIATSLFIFGGGSAWIASLFYNDFWTASYLSLDANFGDSWLVTGLWAYKALGLLFALLATLLFTGRELLKEKTTKPSTIVSRYAIYTLFPLCVALSILSYPYGIVLTIGAILSMAIAAGSLTAAENYGLDSKGSLKRTFFASLVAVVIITAVDSLSGNILARFAEERLSGFYGLHINSYFVIFSMLFGGLVLSVYVCKFVSTVALRVGGPESHMDHNDSREEIHRRVVGILVVVLLGVFLFETISWLVNPQPEEYLLTLTNWPLKYAVARYSFIFALSLATSIIAYFRGYTNIALANVLAVFTVIFISTLVPLPLKARTMVAFKIVLVIPIGYGMLKIAESEQKNLHNKDGLKQLLKMPNLISACLATLLVFSMISSGYFWYDALQRKYPVDEIELSDWVINNTQADMNLRFITTSEWLTTKSIEWLAAKPNIALVEPRDIDKAVDILSSNVQKYGQVYIVSSKFSETGRELHKTLNLLLMNGLVISVHENDAYAVHMTTDRLYDVQKRAESLTHPLSAIDFTDLVLYESFDDYDIPGVWNNATFVNNSALILKSNVTFNGEFSISLWLRIEAKGEMLFMEFDSGYLRLRTNNQNHTTLVLYHKNTGEPMFIPIRATYQEWIHLIIQADEDKLGVYENGNLLVEVEDETVSYLTNNTLESTRISDKVWWDTGFRGIVDELIINSEIVPYEDILTLYLSYEHESQ